MRGLLALYDNPFLSLYWLVTGKTIGGLNLYPAENRFNREEALKLYTVGSSWFSTEDGKKGALAPGQLADLAVLSADYFSIPEEQIKQLESVLTVVGGKIVYATAEFSKLGPPALPVSPSWSPVKQYGGYAKSSSQAIGASHSASSAHAESHDSAAMVAPVPLKGQIARSPQFSPHPPDEFFLSCGQFNNFRMALLPPRVFAYSSCGEFSEAKRLAQLDLLSAGIPPMSLE